MLISRTLARARIAKEVRPSWSAAWLPVLLDAIVLLAILFALFPFIQAEIDARGYGMGVTVFVLFGLYFVPIQVVLITSSLWAAKSRGLFQAQNKKEHLDG